MQGGKKKKKQSSQAGCRSVMSKTSWNQANSSHKGTEGRSGNFKKELSQSEHLQLRALLKISLSLSTSHSGQRPRKAAFYCRHQKGCCADMLFRQKTATSGVTINQHIRKTCDPAIVKNESDGIRPICRELPKTHVWDYELGELHNKLKAKLNCLLKSVACWAAWR